MTLRTDNSSFTAALVEPKTEAGRALRSLILPHLNTIRASAFENDRRGAFPGEIFAALRKDGVLGATVPADLGGLGVECMHDVAFALRLVAEADASTALALHMQLSRGLTLGYEWRRGPAVARALSERLLRAMAAGEAVVPTGVKDIPKGGVVTELRRAGTGGWLLTGGKTLVSLSPAATHFAVYAKAHVPDGPARSAMAVLTRDRPGLTVLDNWDGLGMRASGTVDLLFDDCAIPEEDVILRGVHGAQDNAMLAGQTVSSVTMLGIYYGIAHAARDIAVDTLLKRGSAKPAARTLVAEIDVKLHTLRSSVGAALAVADELAYRETADPGERGLAMMTPFQAAKLAVNRLAPEVVNEAMFLVGGASYTGAHPLSRLYRDVRAGAFMHPFTYVDAVDYLSGLVLPS
ncbi:acyl-CoA/acyl-ACP dehydrogenase [Nonomuraea sp. NN258]|uniref:acyl-CoA dehydrogenase family protein n=1 Tax=Nonomuraea antri TaxID=2730852 RepID=UPI001567E4BF|nr:acyl-CoA dehydrogenase family protein [Nonomuraea antri]NRQ31671.1 acyl-CoA/acyl-ACP dehydrogenase [Nonomuraea antri]